LVNPVEVVRTRASEQETRNGKRGELERSKYNDLVDVLADGLFEMLRNGNAPVPVPRKRWRGARARA
jgi:hypothetical protein